MRTRPTSRTGGHALVVALLLLAPAVAATTVLVNATRPADADLMQRDYFAVAAGASDGSVGDVVVVTTVKCDADGCDRDVWYRFMHAPSRVPTIASVADALDACLEALVAANCGDAALRTTFQDLPIADTDLDEAFAFTDGRYVVYAAGPAGGTKDVYRFDLRRPHGPTLVVGTGADETPFGVGGDWVGVRTLRADGLHDLAAVNARTGATRALAVVNATDPAALSGTRVAWSTGPTIAWQVLLRDAPPTYFAHGERVVRALHLWNERLVWVESKECAAGASTCNDLVTPARRNEVRGLVFLNYTSIAEQTPAPPHSTTSNYYGRDANHYVSVGANPPQSASAFTTARSCPGSGITEPVSVRIFHDALFVRTNRLDCTGTTTTEGIQVVDPRSLQPPSTPASWSNRPPGQLGEPAASNRYVYLLDYDGARTKLDAHPWVHCYAPTQPNGAAGSSACVGAGPLHPGGALATRSTT